MEGVCLSTVLTLNNEAHIKGDINYQANCKDNVEEEAFSDMTKFLSKIEIHRELPDGKQEQSEENYPPKYSCLKVFIAAHICKRVMCDKNEVVKCSETRKTSNK